MSTFSQFKSFPKPARLFLLAVIINGIIFSTWQLFFNLFFVARGVEKDFLGLINSMPSIAGLILGIPIGMLSDRIGRRQAMLAGLSIYIFAMGSQLFLTSKFFLLAAASLGGVGNTLFFISQAPFMMKVSTFENRSLLFSLNFGLATLAGAFGNLFAGMMPGWFADLLNIPVNSAQSYQMVLLASVLLGLFALIPIYVLKEPDSKRDSDWKPAGQFVLLKQAIRKPLTLKLILPEMLLGFGAAITIPYMNLYFVETFQLESNKLGQLFSLGSLFVGVGSILGPKLVQIYRSKIKVVVLTQSISIIFLLILAFSPFAWFAAIGYLLRGMLMNMATPLYNAFCMERVEEYEQGVINSLISNSWTAGWAIGPFLSGLIQLNYGFKPLFIATASIYCLSILSTWVFFHKMDQPEKVEQAIVEGPHV
jgi:MFS family permease